MLLPTAPPPQASRLRLWLRVGTLALCALAMAGAVYLAVVDREEVLVRAEEQADTMANYLSEHARDTFEIAGLALTSVGRLIGSGALTESEIERVRLDMRALLHRVPRLSRLSFYEQSGWLITSSEETANSATKNISRTAAFEAHRKSLDPSADIGDPYQLAGSGPWFIDVTQVVPGSDGEFGGLLVATMRVQYFADFYDSFEHGENARISLLGRDGHLLAHNPYDEKQIGMDLSKSEVFQEVLAGHSVGHMRVVSPIDGLNRLAAFHVVGGQPLTIVYSVTEDAVLAKWKEGLLFRAIMAGALMLAVLFAANRFGRFVERRMSSEAKLLEMSQTDALTGLLNRRAFDHTIAREWLRCVVSAAPLSMLMIDVDHFKNFNDTYGHQGGDDCLKAVSQAIRETLHLSNDRVMRYGGEEFAVLLPDTGPQHVATVAERIRRAIEGLRIPHSGSDLGCVTVSVGYATEDRGARTRGSEAQLIADADRALYAAKLDGRNRIVCGDASVEKTESTTVTKPRLIYDSRPHMSGLP